MHKAFDHGATSVLIHTIIRRDTIKEYADIHINETPFSRYGAYISVCHKPGENTLTVHNVKRRFGQDEL